MHCNKVLPVLPSYCYWYGQRLQYHHFTWEPITAKYEIQVLSGVDKLYQQDEMNSFTLLLDLNTIPHV